MFDTSDLKSMRGSVEAGAPKNLVFHPVLKMGIGLGDNMDLHHFNPKSLVIRKKESLERMPHTFWFDLLASGAKGKKLIYLREKTAVRALGPHRRRSESARRVRQARPVIRQPRTSGT